MDRRSIDRAGLAQLDRQWALIWDVRHGRCRTRAEARAAGHHHGTVHWCIRHGFLWRRPNALRLTREGKVYAQGIKWRPIKGTKDADRLRQAGTRAVLADD